MAHKQTTEPAETVTSAAGPSVLDQWRRDGATLSDKQQVFPGRVRTVKRLGRILKFARKDAPALAKRGTTQEHLDALQTLHDEGKAMRPMPQQEKANARSVPKAPKGLRTQAYQRVMGTRSVAASRLGETSPLTVALGFKVAVQKHPAPLSRALLSQRSVILQKDDNGQDLKDPEGRDPSFAAHNRATLAQAGLDATYVADMIAPILVELAPYVGSKNTTEAPSVLKWECVGIVAAKYFYEQAELALQSSGRVVLYRNAQPLSQAGRFTKKKGKKKTKGKGDQKSGGTPPGDQPGSTNPQGSGDGPSGGTPSGTSGDGGAGGTKPATTSGSGEGGSTPGTS